jgi:hypothetical protein
VEAIEKPGNLGTILRSADAAGVDALIVCDPVTDLFNPNVVRASIGTLFSVPLAVASSDETLAWLRARPAPLSISLFGPTAAEEAAIAAGTRAGAITVGRCIDHVAWAGLGFGGVGGSGFGRYHGRAGFEAFSDRRARVRHGGFALARMLDPPRGPRTKGLLDRLLR